MQDSDEGRSSHAPTPAEAQPADQCIAVTNGNGSAMQHHNPTYTSFNADSAKLYPEWGVPEPVAVPRSITANTARLYPEWGMPEPVAVPHTAQAVWGSARSHQQDAAAQQLQPVAAAEPSDAQRSRVPDAHHAQPHNAVQEQQAGPAAQPMTSQAADVGEQQEVQGAAQHDSQLVSAPAQDAQSAEVPVEGQSHPSVGQVSLAQPSTSEPAALQQQLSHSQQITEPPSVLSQTAAQQASAAMQRSIPSEPQQPHQHPGQLQQQLQEHPDQQLLLRLEQDQSEQPLMQPPSNIDELPGDSGQRLQETGAGPPSDAPLTIGPSMGAYSQRELFLQNLEQAGEMSFEYVLNDGQRHNSIWSVAHCPAQASPAHTFALSTVQTCDCLGLLLSFIQLETHDAGMHTAGCNLNVQLAAMQLLAVLVSHLGMCLLGCSASYPPSPPPLPASTSRIIHLSSRIATHVRIRCTRLLLSLWQAHCAEEHLLKAAAQHAARVHSTPGAGPAASLCGHCQEEQECGGRHHLPPLPPAALWGDCLLCSHCQ